MPWTINASHNSEQGKFKYMDVLKNAITTDYYL